MISQIIHEHYDSQFPKEKLSPEDSFVRLWGENFQGITDLAIGLFEIVENSLSGMRFTYITNMRAIKKFTSLINGSIDDIEITGGETFDFGEDWLVIIVNYNHRITEQMHSYHSQKILKEFETVFGKDCVSFKEAMLMSHGRSRFKIGFKNEQAILKRFPNINNDSRFNRYNEISSSIVHSRNDRLYKEQETIPLSDISIINKTIEEMGEHMKECDAEMNEIQRKMDAIVVAKNNLHRIRNGEMKKVVAISDHKTGITEKINSLESKHSMRVARSESKISQWRKRYAK